MISVKRLIGLVPVMALALSACTNNRATEVGDPNSDFYLALPRIEISIDKDGNPSLANIDLKTVEALTGNTVDLSAYRLDPAYVAWLSSAGVQNIEIVHKGDGLFLFQNNKPLPHIGWNGESIASVGSTVSDLGSKTGMMDANQANLVKKLLPFLRRLGVDVAVKFPVPDGAQPLELRPAGGKIEAKASAASDPIVQTKLVVNYDANGTPSVAGLSAADLAAIPGMEAMGGLNLDPTLVKNMTDLGIQHISLKTDKDGVLIALNDKQLPSIVWTDEYLSNTAELISALNTYPGMEQVNGLVKDLLPKIKDANVELALRFPLAPGAQALPSPLVTFAQ